MAEIIGYIMKLKGDAARKRFTAAPKAAPGRPANIPKIGLGRLAKNAGNTGGNVPRTDR